MQLKDGLREQLADLRVRGQPDPVSLGVEQSAHLHEVAVPLSVVLDPGALKNERELPLLHALDAVLCAVHEGGGREGLHRSPHSLVGVHFRVLEEVVRGPAQQRSVVNLHSHTSPRCSVSTIYYRHRQVKLSSVIHTDFAFHNINLNSSTFSTSSKQHLSLFYWFSQKFNLIKMCETYRLFRLFDIIKLIRFALINVVKNFEVAQISTEIKPLIFRKSNFARVAKMWSVSF